MAKITADKLKLGDVIQCFEGPFSTGIVTQLDQETVKVFRPYGKHDDFSYTGGVICYVGIEQYHIARIAGLEYEVYQRTDLK